MFVRPNSNPDFDAYTDGGTPIAYMACGDSLCNECASKSGDDCKEILMEEGESVRCVDCGTLISYPMETEKS